MKDTDTTNTAIHTSTLVGAICGLAIFLVVGLLPSLLYGGYGGVMLASAISGEPIEAGLLARATVLLGMVFGLLATSALFTVTGAIVGSGLYSTFDLMATDSPAQQDTTDVERVDADHAKS